MDQNKVTELLKNYRSYRYAISNGVASHQSDDTTGMPLGGGYGSRPPAGFGGRGTILSSLMDYQRYKLAVTLIDGAVRDVLDDEERNVIELKYMERNTLTLALIAERKGPSEKTVRNIHKRALNKLTVALRFVDTPEIINLDEVIVV
ncbi:sigma factor-like helix-turn-helix DNA-binding protein [Paenibacillus chitinolyticus]